MALLYLLDSGNELAVLVLIYLILSVYTDNGLIGRYLDNIETVYASELGFLCHCSTGHAGKLAVQTEEVLESDGSESFTLMLYLNALLCFDSLVQTLVEAAPEHESSGELIDYNDLAVLDNILDVTVHTAVSLDRLVHMVQYGEVVGIHEVVNAEILLGFLYAVGEQRCGLCLFINDVVGGKIVLFLLGIHLDHLVGSHGACQLVRSLVQVGGLVAASGDDKRSPRFVYKDRIDFIDDREVHFALHLILLAYAHIVTQIVKAEFVVCSVCYIAGISGAALLVVEIMYDESYGESEEAVNASDKLGVTLCEVIVDCNDMNALACQSV